jgi:signal transduction histidine kinase
MHGKTLNTQSTACSLLVMALLFSLSGLAQQGDTTAPVVVRDGSLGHQIEVGKIYYWIDSAKRGITRLSQADFSVSYSTFLARIQDRSTLRRYWLKFDLSNQTNQTLRIYLYCGVVNYTDLYIVSETHAVQHIQGGNLFRFPSDSSFLQQVTQTLCFNLLPQEKAVAYLRLKQRTETFDYQGIYLYDRSGLFQTIGEDDWAIHGFLSFQLVFQGILLCQLLYVLFQWMILRKREYGYYFFYLGVISLYFLSRHEVDLQIRLVFARFPLLRVYLNKTLLMLPYFFYFRFVRSFLDMAHEYPRMNRWLVRMENFLLAYLVFDLAFVLLTFNIKLQRELYTYVLVFVFIFSATFIFLLFREKKTLIYFILSGSLFVGLGNIIGLILTFLEDENIAHHFNDKLIFSQVGILLEIFCFTAGLSYKSMSIEKEKIKSQENLIGQLKANELLQNKMQTIRNKIAQDLHDDIGSTLSSISILSNLALKEKNTDQTLLTMHEIKDSSVTLMEKMDDIVWSINPINDSLENLFSRIRRFATALFEAKNIDYTLLISDAVHPVQLPIEWRQHIYLICKEAINNLVKYSEATKASIQVVFGQDSLEVVIEDNGRGFDSSLVLAGNGLSSMRNRATTMGASLEILSSPGKGCRIGLMVKIG